MLQQESTKSNKEKTIHNVFNSNEDHRNFANNVDTTMIDTIERIKNRR